MKWTHEVECPTCKGYVAMRINRNGFLQRRVFNLFGLYPWKCGACGTAFLYRRRGNRHRPDDQIAEPGASHKHGRA
jgi:hypothetical protein